MNIPPAGAANVPAGAAKPSNLNFNWNGNLPPPPPGLQAPVMARIDRKLENVTPVADPVATALNNPAPPAKGGKRRKHKSKKQRKQKKQRKIKKTRKH